MRKAELAERVLANFIDPQRASAVVGDLEEQSALSWIAVSQIAASSVVADLREQPGALAYLAVRAFILQLGLMFLIRHFFPVHSVWELLSGYPPVRWMWRRAPGREAAACLSLFLVASFWTLLTALNLPVDYPPSAALWVKEYINAQG